jgi:transposase InsO family protein
MQLLSSDYFAYAGKSYLVIVDRYSGWPVIKQCKDETAGELVSALREFFCQFGTPEQLASDGGSVYTSSTTQAFLKTWGVTHRVSTAYNPRSNLRAETAVKSMKRLIQQNVGPSGSLNTDQLAMALLTYRNTPDRDTHRSPAQVLYARSL